MDTDPHHLERVRADINASFEIPKAIMALHVLWPQDARPLSYPRGEWPVTLNEAPVAKSGVARSSPTVGRVLSSHQDRAYCPLLYRSFDWSSARFRRKER